MTEHDPQQDFIDISFKLGEVAGLISRHRKTYPVQVRLAHQLMRDLLPPAMLQSADAQQAQQAIDYGLENINRPAEDDPLFKFWQHGRAYTIAVDTARKLSDDNLTLTAAAKPGIEQDMRQCAHVIAQQTIAIQFMLKHGEVSYDVKNIVEDLMAKLPSAATPTEPPEALIDAVLQAQEEASHLFTRRNKLEPAHAQHELCRQGGGDIEVLASFATDGEANAAWRRAKAKIVAGALLAIPSITLTEGTAA